MRCALVVLGMSALLLLPTPSPAAQSVALDAEPEREPDDEETADVEVPEVWEDLEDSVVPAVPHPGPQTGRTFLGNLSAYSYESCMNPSRCRTRTGTVPTWGTVAVDPAVVPLGSRLLIEQYPGTTFVAEDTGGAVRGNAVDIWHESTAAALRFGRQRGVVTVLD